ncbi:hypothetical protein [Leptobacterium sp. I13]|uniref:hypothetical protein n=1 Tax=Leptobacterium meishanense TaxID=3128904 RepID=UPI0030EC8913
MLKLNKDLNRDKTQVIGNFKIGYGRNEPFHKKRKWVDENKTKEVEFLIGSLFVDYLCKNKRKRACFLRFNSTDDHKKPDLFIQLEGRQVGVQVTQFVIRDYLSRYNQAKRICEKLSGLISNHYKPPIKINIEICTPWDSDEIPMGSSKLYKRLSKIIADNISENIENLKTRNNNDLYFDLSKSDFKTIAESYRLYPVPTGYQSSYYGNDNVYIDYGFDNIIIFKEDIIETAEKIYNNKNKGDSEILVIWGDENHFMNITSLIVEQLKKQFIETSFTSVYYLGFHNVLVSPRRIYYERIK